MAAGTTADFEYQGKVGEYTDGLFQLTDMQGKGRLREQDWRMRLNGAAYAGKFTADLEDPQPATLTINELQLSDMQPELQLAGGNGWRPSPFSRSIYAG